MSNIKVPLFILMVLVVPSLFSAPKTESAEKAMGGPENLHAVLSAEVVSFEKVTVPPITKVIGFKDGHLQTEELTVNNWSWGMRLLIEKGPVAVPSSIAERLRKSLMSADVISELKLGCRYYPTHRFELREKDHILEIFVLETTGGFEIYRDGVRIGSRTGDHRIVHDLEMLFQQPKKETNQAVGSD